MATLFCGAAPVGVHSLLCRPEEDPFLLLESSRKAVQKILVRRRGLPLRRTWIKQHYGEPTLFEEEVLPVLQRSLLRVDELDQRLVAQQEVVQRCRMELSRDALAELRPRMG